MSSCTKASAAPPSTVTAPTTASRLTLETPMLNPWKNTPYMRPTM